MSSAPPSTAALLLSFEGTEGCGKSTQIRLLQECLIAKGLRVEVLREPGGTSVGEAIRHLLQHAREGEGLVAEAELLLFAASRAQLIRERVVPLLRQGVWVILDRYVDSTTVYQGIGRGLPLQTIENLNAFASDGLLPHLTFLLDLEVTRASARIEQSGRSLDRMERQPQSFFEAIRAGYLHLAETQPQRIRRINADQPREQVHSEILQHLSPHLHGASA